MAKYIPKVNLISLGTALILFLFPWTEVTCNAKHVASQSGLQATYGGVSPAADLKADGTKDKSDLGGAALVSIALFVILGGAVIAGLVFLGRNAPPIPPGLLAAVAFVLIGFQAVIGFPINKAAQEQQSSTGKQADEMAKAMGSMIGIEVERTAWFFLELLALLLPAALYGNEWLAKRKAAAQPANPSPPPS